MPFEAIPPVVKILSFFLSIWNFFSAFGKSRNLGKSLTNRKIAIFVEGEDKSNLEGVLIDSGLFKKDNIIHCDKNSIRRAEDISLLLMHWQSSHEQLDEILKIKKDGDSLIIYAPDGEKPLDDEDKQKIGKERNTILVNFRGRLINDIFVCMILPIKRK